MPTLSPIYETRATTVTPCMNCAVPGYMIVQPKQLVARIGQAPEFATELGDILSRLEHALLSPTGATRIYILRFSETHSSVHFHVFPRTEEMAARYIQAMRRLPGQIIGPELFEWARQEFYIADAGQMPRKIADMAERISRLMQSPDV
jgi:diadenosine tetraphosphate (Ap4A) HIT family hydrolase